MLLINTGLIILIKIVLNQLFIKMCGNNDYWRCGIAMLKLFFIYISLFVFIFIFVIGLLYLIVGIDS
ncbi:hypothetical protein C4B60_19405 [Jeotgalibacillus proteolyticus]|uniref:Uncharacterized protein n=1 Tax=Jeotgalibacillus proteolyticus TaxID=2082395 RepID=A0A2S5G728_9BACL|nr:hypothetical protein C4B60_19405 [Jeotgalibacillus proteolyticus]